MLTNLFGKRQFTPEEKAAWLADPSKWLNKPLNQFSPAEKAVWMEESTRWHRMGMDAAFARVNQEDHLELCRKAREAGFAHAYNEGFRSGGFARAAIATRTMRLENLFF